MIIPQTIVDRLQRRSGVAITHATDRELSGLLDAMYAETGVRIGLNTLKRMLGKISDQERETRNSTLDVIARYLGEATWENLLLSVSNGDSSFANVPGEVRTADLKTGDVVEMSYMPDRKLQFEKTDDEDIFRVKSSLNSKLQEGDLCKICSFVIRYPLIVHEVIRNGESLGSYTAAHSGGIITLKVNE